MTQFHTDVHHHPVPRLHESNHVSHTLGYPSPSTQTCFLTSENSSPSLTSSLNMSFRFLPKFNLVPESIAFLDPSNEGLFFFPLMLKYYTCLELEVGSFLLPIPTSSHSFLPLKLSCLLKHTFSYCATLYPSLSGHIWTIESLFFTH